MMNACVSRRSFATRARVTAWLAVLLLAWSGTAPSGARRSGERELPVNVVPGLVIVKFVPGVSPDPVALFRAGSSLQRTLRAAGVTSLERMFPQAPSLERSVETTGRTDLSRIVVARLAPETDHLSALAILRRNPAVEYAEPKYLHRLLDVPNDPTLANQSSVFQLIRAFDGWTLAKGDRSVAIATIDGGTLWQHEDLSGNLWINTPEDINANGRFDAGPPPAGDEDGLDQDNNGYRDDVIGWNFSLQSNNPNAPPLQPGNFSHGTATASHSNAVTNNGAGMAGSSWNCSLMPVCAAWRSGDNLIGYGYEGIEYAFRNGAKVINCSWGRSGGFSRLEQDVINAAAEAGALVVASAGNDGIDNDYAPGYPCNYANVLSVGATTSSSDAKAPFSNYGTSVPVYAPGENIWSALTNGSYGNGGSGTSYSSPLVAGLAGILRSAHPGWAPRQIAAQIRVTADSMDLVPANAGLAGKLGRGRVNFARALTENRAALDIQSYTLQTPDGGDLFLQGDTLLLRVVVRNVLFVPASNLQFACTPDLPTVDVLQGSAAVAQIAPGDSLVLPVFSFRVRSMSQSTVIVLKLRWSAAGNYHDAAAFRTIAFPVVPAWLKQESPTTVPLFSVKSVSGTVAWASGGDETATLPTVLRTTDGGVTWENATGDIPPRDLYCIEAVDASRAWVGTANGEIYATTDAGASWARQSYPAPFSPFINAIRCFGSGLGYAMGDPPAGTGKFVVLRTTNGGSTWAHLASEPTGPIGEAGWNNSFWWTDSLNGWFGTNAGKNWRTTNGGQSWTSSTSGSTNSVGISFGTPLRGVAVHNDGVISRTENGGQSWTTAVSPTTDGLVAVAFAPGTPFAWTGTSERIYATRDDGLTWNSQPAYPFEGGLTHFSFVDTARGWAVTRSGEILRFNVGGDTSVTGPTTYLLDQNFPNPFNAGTTIRFRVPRESRVLLELFDVLGARVAVLYDGNCLPGIYDIRYDVRRLATGPYFYRITAEETEGGQRFTQSRKLLYLK